VAAFAASLGSKRPSSSIAHLSVSAYSSWVVLIL
jgi:hypothetical protein